MVQALHIDQLLQAQERLLTQVDTLLQSELDVLLAGNIEQLPDLAERKTMLCAELERLEQARLEEDRGAQRTSPSQPVPENEPAGRTDRIRKIRQLSQAICMANQRNGLVVSALLRNTQGALDILRGIPGATGESVYGPYGQSLAGRQAVKPLASA